MHPEEMEGVEVEVEEVIYLAGLDAPEDRPFPFTYYIHITNHSGRPLKIIGRKWIIEQDNGDVHVVEGDGVVGKTPEIPDGGGFHYNSYLFVGDHSRVTGSYLGELEDGHRVLVRVPEFEMRVPTWA